MTATAPRPVARLLPVVGKPMCEGSTFVLTECCDVEILHDVDSSGDDDAFNMTAWWRDGEQVTACPCGHALPDAKAWRP